MRDLLNLLESIGSSKTLFHGGDDPQPHNGMYFSTQPSFAESYGVVNEYNVTLGKIFDSLDERVIEPLLPLYDPYDEVEINSINAYMERTSDTWEIIEQHLSYIRGMGYDSVRIFEGGTENYYVFDKDNIKLIGEFR